MEPSSTRCRSFWVASRTAINSEWAVASEVETFRLRVRLSTSPLRTITEPNGCSPSRAPSFASSIAIDIHRSCSVMASPGPGRDARMVGSITSGRPAKTEDANTPLSGKQHPRPWWARSPLCCRNLLDGAQPLDQRIAQHSRRGRELAAVAAEQPQVPCRHDRFVHRHEHDALARDLLGETDLGLERDAVLAGREVDHH